MPKTDALLLAALLEALRDLIADAELLANTAFALTTRVDSAKWTAEDGPELLQRTQNLAGHMHAQASSLTAARAAIAKAEGMLDEGDIAT